MRVGVWWNVGGRDTWAHLQHHLAAVEELGIAKVMVVINDIEDTHYRCRWGLGTLTNLVHGLQGIGVEVGLTSWVYPTRAFIEAMATGLPDVAGLVGVRAIELDCEGNWKKEHLKGYASLEEAADALCGYLHEAEGIDSVGVTTYPTMVDRIPELTRWADEVAVQAFSVASKPECVWGGRYGPGRMQVTASDKWRKAEKPEGQKLVMGLPVWDQAWKGHTIGEAVGMEWSTTRALKVDEVRLWSWAHLAGKSGKARGPCWELVKERVG